MPAKRRPFATLGEVGRAWWYAAPFAFEWQPRGVVLNAIDAPVPDPADDDQETNLMLTPMLATDCSKVFGCDHTELRRRIAAGEVAMATGSPARWTLETKLDGIRCMAVHTGERIRFRGRDGQQLTKPIPLPIRAALEALPLTGPWALDGELFDGALWLFDAPHVEGIVAPGRTPLHQRREVLARLVDILDDPAVRLVPWWDAEAIGPAWDALASEGAEGVVLKKATSGYQQGRTRDWVKVKFTATIDCVVTDLCRGGKENLGLAVYDPTRPDSPWVDVGEVSRLTGDGPRAAVGDVVEVTVHSVSAAGRLREPTRPIIRTDKSRAECTVDQLDAARKGPRR